MVVAGAVVLALVGWILLFRMSSEGIWPRTWLVAVALSGYSVAVLAATNRLRPAFEPYGPEPVLAGLGMGVGWLVATHVGHKVMCRFIPGFLDQVSDLYSLRAGDRVRTIVGPVTAMGIAEELLFRGVLQARIGLAGAVVVYTLVQLVAANWALLMAGALCGVVWGSLTWWQGSLVAPVIAHVVWTGALTFVWPLRGCGKEPGAADVAPLAGEAPVAGGASCDPSPSVPSG